MNLKNPLRPNNMNKTNTPQIRFKGFTEAWEQRKLGNCSDLLTGYPFESKRFETKGIPLVRGMNVKRGYLDMTNEVCEYWPDSKGLETFLLKAKDIIIQMDGALIGKSYAIIQKENIPALLVQRVTRVRSKNQDADFIYQSIQRGFLSYIRKIKTETAVPHLSLEDIREYPLSFPKNEMENQQIGNFFNNFDNLITLHQRKCEMLQKTKKALLEKMFPQNGSAFPEVRFKGFTEAWEQRKVGNICSISTGKSNTQDKVDDGIYPFYVRSPIVEHSNKYLYDEEAVLTVGDGVGTGKVFHYVNGKYDLHQRVYRMFGFSEDVSAKFFYDWFSEHFYKRVMAMTAKTSVDSVRYEMIADMDIQLPSLPEQKAIADFFFSLDNLITLHQRELEKLQKLKSACLQKMFV
jgi:type I restriction enzyme S subunit